MHQNQAVILRQLCYGKISFLVLVPGDNADEDLQVLSGLETWITPA